MSREQAPLSMSACVHVTGRPVVSVSPANNGHVALTIKGDDVSYPSVTLFFDNLECADAVADAIFHAKMDADADAIQAATIGKAN
jgi:hypothetical protein